MEMEDRGSSMTDGGKFEARISKLGENRTWFLTRFSKGNNLIGSRQV